MFLVKINSSSGLCVDLLKSDLKIMAKNTERTAFQRLAMSVRRSQAVGLFGA